MFWGGFFVGFAAACACVAGYALWLIATATPKGPER